MLHKEIDLVKATSAWHRLVPLEPVYGMRISFSASLKRSIVAVISLSLMVP